mmetsp:Transcript_116162/g.335472  ORF Transcript_116162/g.335472 Transcript_116162/m.335472 type:complete len:240 (+) Transcript_116162:932-1651(+)
MPTRRLRRSFSGRSRIRTSPGSSAWPAHPLTRLSMCCVGPSLRSKTMLMSRTRRIRTMRTTMRSAGMCASRRAWPPSASSFPTFHAVTRWRRSSVPWLLRASRWLAARISVACWTLGRLLSSRSAMAACPRKCTWPSRTRTFLERSASWAAASSRTRHCRVSCWRSCRSCVARTWSRPRTITTSPSTCHSETRGSPPAMRHSALLNHTGLTAMLWRWSCRSCSSMAGAARVGRTSATTA